LAEIGRLPKFGFESYLNKLIIQNKLKIKVVFWKGVRSPWKYEKSGLLKGVKSDILMLADILRTIPPWEVVYQFVKMISLRVK
jgi:hypothetical protein